MAGVACSTTGAVIDDFESGGGVLEDPPGAPPPSNRNETGLSGDSVIGGEREVTVNRTVGNGKIYVDVNSGGYTGRARILADAGTGGNVVFSYGSYAATGTPLNSDVSSDTHVKVKVLAADWDASFNTEVSGSSGPAAVIGTPVSATSGETDFLVPFSEFGGFNFGDTDGFQVTVFLTPPVTEIIIELIETTFVPEPTTVAAMVLGALAVLGRRARHH